MRKPVAKSGPIAKSRPVAKSGPIARDPGPASCARPRAMLLAGLCAALSGVLLAGGCRSWEETKRTYVDELNELLHRRYPEAHREKSLEGLLALYSPEIASDPDFAGAKRRLLDSFDEIARAHCVIESLEPPDRDGQVAAKLRLEIHGTRDGAVAGSRYERLDAACTRVEGAWRISRELVVETSSLAPLSVHFREESLERGLDNRQDMGGVEDSHGVPQRYPGGSGLAVGDWDGDGLDDVYFANGLGCRLFQNLGGGRFGDVTEATGTHARAPGRSRCALIADFDNDGDADIFVGRIDGPHLFYRQDGPGVFHEVAARLGLSPAHETSSACAADFNGDGRLDIYVANCGNLTRMSPEPQHNALNAAPNTLFLQSPDGTFIEAAERAGVAHRGFGLGCAAADHDGDGDVDLFVANDFGFDVLYENRGDGTFQDVTGRARLLKRGAGMSAAWGDIDGDGLPELFVGGMHSNSQWMLDQPGHPLPAPWPIRILFRRQVIDIIKESLGGNDFYRNNGDGTFARMAPETRNSGWSWSSVFLDFDNDSLLDIYAVNGFISGEDREDL